MKFLIGLKQLIDQRIDEVREEYPIIRDERRYGQEQFLIHLSSMIQEELEK